MAILGGGGCGNTFTDIDTLWNILEIFHETLGDLEIDKRIKPSILGAYTDEKTFHFN